KTANTGDEVLRTELFKEVIPILYPLPDLWGIRKMFENPENRRIAVTRGQNLPVDILGSYVVFKLRIRLKYVNSARVFQEEIQIEKQAFIKTLFRPVHHFRDCEFKYKGRVGPVLFAEKFNREFILARRNMLARIRLVWKVDRMCS
ncbi:hypothetical protein DX904_12430, partial [Adlercreutzia equolifaciens subsp. celatus]